MALNLPTPLESGFTASYWKIVKLEIDPVAKSALAVLALYKDKAARMAAPVAGIIRREPINLVGDQYPYDISDQEWTNPFELAYQKVKLNNQFSEATDI